MEKVLLMGASIFSPNAKEVAFWTCRTSNTKRVFMIAAALELGDDVIELIAERLLRTCAVASRYESTSKCFLVSLRSIARRLAEQESIITWTGNHPPIKPPASNPSLAGLQLEEWHSWNNLEIVPELSISKLSLFVRGATVADDIPPLLRNQWCTNFTILCCLKAAGMDDGIIIKDDGAILTMPRLLPPCLGARMSLLAVNGDQARLSSIQLGSTPSSPNLLSLPACFAKLHPSWADQVASAPFVLLPLNSFNAHWSLVRIWRLGPAELFESLPGASDLGALESVLELLTHLGWPSGKRIRTYTFTHYHQHDGVSCGIMTAAAAISLLGNCQLGVQFADLADWKAFFAHTIYCKLLELEAPPGGDE